MTTVNVREIMRDIKARTSDSSGPQSSGLKSQFVPASLAEYDWSELEKAAGFLESISLLVGQIPPQPPTFRGRLGAFLVNSIRRALFWYTPQIVTFNQAATHSINLLFSAIQTIEKAGQQSLAAADMLNRQVADLWAESERLKAILGMRRKEIQAIIKMELSPENQARQGLESRFKDLVLEFEGFAEMLRAESEAREELASLVKEETATRRNLSQALVVETGMREEIARRVDAESSCREALASGLAAECAAREALASRVTAETAARGGLTETLALEAGARKEIALRLAGEIAAREALAHEVIAASGRSQEFEAELLHSDARITQMRAEVIGQSRRISILLEEARKRLPAPFDESHLVAVAAQEKHALDALYVSFEDTFRGTRADIKDRSRIFLPFLHEQKIGADQMPILDIGCGRGEWLELLLENNLEARGIDINSILLAYCREAGLNVAEADVLEYLKSQPDNSIGAVTGFHIIEHLPFHTLVRVMDETVRVLKPGGIAIFETPNPQNVLVGSHNFYLDFTHRNPLPPQTTQFVLEARGLCDVRILDLHPYPESSKLRDDQTEVVKRFNEYFYGPQDYAVVGRKA